MPEGRVLLRPLEDRLIRRTAGVVVLTLIAGLLAVTGVTPSAPARAAVSVSQVGAWSFDAGSGTTAADSAGSHPLTLTSSSAWTPGIRGASALNSAAGQATSAAVLNTTQSFSVTAYVKLNNVSNYQTIVSQDGNSLSNFFLQVRGDTGKFAFTRHSSDDSNSGAAIASSTAAPVVGQWYHLAGIYDATAGTLALYVNGRLQQSVTAPATWASTGSFAVGRARFNGGAVDNVNGVIDDVRAYSGALTAADVEQISDAAYWKFDEGSGTSAADAGLNGTTATLTNGPTWGTGVKPPYAVQLDGTNDLVDPGKTVIDTSKSFTIAAWARTTSTGAVGVVASVDGTNQSAFTLQVGADGKWAFTRPASDTAGATVTSVASTGVAATSWHHLVAVYDSVAQTMTLYANGTSQATASYATGWAGTGNFVLGRGKSGGAAAGYFTGSIDEVHVYPFAVDAAMVTALAAKPVPPVPATPTATTPSSTSVTLSWVAPPSVTNADTTGYTVTPYVNGTAQTPQTFNTTATTQTFAGLTPGSSYRYTVAAINSTGTSGPSNQSAAVTPNAVPGTPTAPTATAGTQRATVTWTAPSNSGTAITGYVVTPYIGSTAQATQTFSGTATTQTVTGLTAGTAYTFTVAAQNAAGTGSASAASNAVTPNSAPTVSSATPPGGVVGTAYSFTFTASGGTAPSTWSVSTGSLPAGLTLSSAGVLSGTPTTVGMSSFTVQVSDASGSTATQSVSLVVSSTTPSAPAKPTAAAGVTSATVSWSAPAANGSAITGYVVTPYLSGAAQTAVSFDASVTARNLTGLTAGGSYTFTVAAVNDNGTGPASPQSTAVTVYDVPSAPTITAATAGTQRATLTWTAPANNGSAITGYVVTPYIGSTAQTATTFTGTATTQTVTGLTAGTAYTFKVAAQNAAGTGAQSAASSAVTPNANPAVTSTSPPGGVVGTAYSYQLTNSGGTSPFTWSVSTGTLPAGLTLSSAGLISGTPTTAASYTFTVQVSDASSQTATSSLTVVVASTTPAAPAKPTAAAGVTSATVSWSAPAANGSAITGYVVTPYLSGVAQTAVSFDASVTARNITGLTAGGSYTFTVAAVNANGTGPASPQSSAVTVYDVPSAPTITAATAGDLRATLTWTAPANNGSAITGYVVTPYIGTTAQTATTFASTATTQTITGLTAGTAYTFKVAAQNAAGTGPQSAASSAVTPNANPTVTSTSPPGGAIGTAYSYQLTVGGGTSPFTWTIPTGILPAGLTLSSAGLISGTPTTAGTSSFTVQVSDANSQSATSSLSIVITSTTPAAPAKPTATAGVTSATVSWTAPASNGSAITGYVVTPYLSGVAQTPVSFDASATSRTITGLTGGGSYTFTVAAVNANGTGPASPQSTAVTVTDVPAAPTITAATAGDLRATLTWTAGSANGSAITGYVVTPYIGSTAQTATTFSSTATTQTITGLTAGTAYTFKVAAQNAVGTGPQSAASSSVTPNANPILAFAAPPGGVVGSAYSYQLTATGGTAPFTWSVTTGTLPAGLTLSSGGLLSGTPTTVGSSTFTVQVSDANSQTATQSTTVTVSSRPAAPAAPTATAGLTSAVLTWTAPAANGSTITGYVITPFIGGTAQPTITVDPSAKTRTLNGLTAGSIYTFTIAAANANGTGTASTASNPVTPYAALNAPTIGSVTSGTTSATVSWTAPSSTGGSAITGYVVTPYIGSTAQTPQTFTGTATTRTLTGLTPSTAYTFKVAALNNSGTTVLNRLASAGTVTAVDGGPDWVDNSSYRSGSSDSSNFGSINSLDSTVPATTPPALFYTERYANSTASEMSYAIPVTTGLPITVRLYFANQYGGTTSVGDRVFNVALDGSTVLPGFDVIAAAGATRIGTMREFAVTSDGTVNLDFSHTAKSDPVIYGIEILQTGTATTGPQSAASTAVTPNATPVVTSTSPPAGVVGTAYTYQLTNSGGTSPFTWSVSSGTLPAGLTLSSGGLLGGTPTAVGSSTFTVQVSDASSQTATQSLTVVVSDKPGTIAKPTAAAGPTSATVSWTAPASNGSTITGYVVTPYLSGAAQTPVTFDASATTRTVTGLTVGGSYKFTVAAVNANGTGTASPQSDAVTIYDVPSAPTITAATAGDLRATLTWTAAAANGNAVTGYVVTPYIGGTAQTPVTFFSTALTQTITGLTAGTAYTFRVAGQNAGGTGAQSAASSAVTPNANPTVTSTSPPAGVVGTAYSYQLTNSGGTSPFTWSVITGSLPAGLTLSSAGLLSGTPTTPGSSAFTVQVSDGNAQTATSALTVVVTSTTPSAPATPTAAAGVTSATVSWSAPAANGSAITGYVVTPYLAGVAQTAVSFDASATARNITGLTGGGSYTFTVAAVNANGTGPASPQSNAVTVTDVPAAPTITAATAGDLRVTLTWSAPASNGSAITGYVVTPYIGSTAQTATTFASTATTQTVTGLTAGTAYTFKVAAQNAAGTGPQSAASSSVTPNANPTLTFSAPPGAVLGTAYSTQLTVTGGTSPFSWSVSAGTLPPGITLSASGLLSGTPTAVGSSTFTVRVSDANAQTATRSVTFVVTDRPAAPATPTATAGLTSAVLTWTAPASNGSTITSYVITPYISGVAQPTITVDPSAKTRTLNGLTAGSSYTFTIAAVNANGTSTASAASNAVTPYAALNAPTIGSVTAGTTSATLSWTAPTSTGGSAVTGYVVTPYIGSVAQTPQTFTGTATTRTVTGLTPGTAYTFQVAAQNNSGTTVLNRLSADPVTAIDGGPDWADNAAYRSGSSNIYHSGVAIGAVDGTVPSTTPLALFRAERWGNDGTNELKYAVPVTTGLPLKVRLYFANTYSGTSSVGARVFDVALDTVTVLPSFDPVAAAGGTSIATMREFALTSDGTVNIDFTHRTDSPAIYGIEILQTGTATTGPPSSASSAVTPNDNPTLTFAAPPSGEVGVAYSQQLVVNGGSAPFTWSVSSGTLPPGLSLGASSGVLSGTPTTAGSSTFTVQVTDAGGATATRSVTLVVAAQPSIAFSPTPGEVGVAYSQQPTLTGGTGPFTWSVSAGSLPGGLSINTSTGLVSGTPTASGTFSVTLRVVDAFNQVATRTASIVIAPLPTLTSTPPRQYQQAGFSFTFAAAGGTGPFSYAVVSGSLPSGVSLSSAGVLSGQTNQGSYSFTVRATDAKGQTADDAVTLVVDAPPVQLVKTASATSVAPGATVTFTLTATNISSTDYGNTHFYDPLADVLDDATYNTNATVSSGTVSYSGSTLDWAIPLNAGQSATLTYTVTVANPDTGNKLLTGQVDGVNSSTSCSGSQRTSACTAAVTVSGLSVSTTANVSTTTPGSTVSYSVVVTNTGQTPYASTSVTQNLSGILDDAVYGGNAAASSGSVSYASPTLTWTGALAVGASVTITYSVRVNDPDTGNRSLTVTALSSAAGSTCPSGSPAASCSSTVTVLVPALSVTTSAAPTTTTPGDRVTFQMTLTNIGQTAYTGTSAALALAGTLDDASYVSAAADSGTVGYASGTVTWTGDLAIGATVVVTVAVDVSDPDPGNRSLVVVASSAAAGSTCPAGSTNASCTTTVPVLIPGLTIATSADVATTTPGSTVSYTVLVTNSGQTAMAGASVSVPLSGVLDDATYNGDVAATVGTAGYASSTISWSGDLAVGASVTITYGVTVRSPDPGDLSLTSTAVSSSRGSTCPAGGGDARCSTAVTVLIPGLSITTAVDSGPTTTPGTGLRYTSTVVNTGQTTYTNVVVVLDARDLDDDATFGNDGTESVGTVTPQPDGTYRWVLSLTPGQSATASSSYRVNDPPTGNRVLRDGVSSSAPGSSCPTSASPSCSTSVTVLVPGLTLSTTANASAVTPGDTVSYTVVATNTGETAYAPAVVSDDLSAVLTDAVYNSDASATTGTPTFSGSTITWSGPLAVGASVTITFTVTVRDPDPGTKQLLNRVVSSAAGSTCPARSTDSRCTASTAVNVPGLTMVAAAGVASTRPGATVTSTVTVTNSGSTAYPSASFTLPLTDVLDDADVTGSVTATSGTASYASSVISWTGSLAVGASATITYSVVVHAADGGNNRLIGTVTSATRGASCAAGSTDPRCTTNVPVARLVIDQVDPGAYTTPGTVLFLSVSYTNTGQVPYTGITIYTPGADTLDDVISGGDQSATSGSLSVTPERLSWTGSIPVGGTVTVSAHATVKDPPTGNRVIDTSWFTTAPGSNCPEGGSTDPRCSRQTQVLIPQLTLTKTASTTATMPGASVSYTITAANTGETPYTGAAFDDQLAGVLDDATFSGSGTTDVGTLSYSGSVLSWSGNLAVGQTATISYTVVANAGTGDKTMTNVISSSDVGSNCPAASGNAACRSTVAVLTPGLTIVQTADLDTATLGVPVTYTVTVRNSGQTSQPSAAFSSDLAAVLDDATFDNAGLSADKGTVSYASGVVSWSGALAPGATATITYRVVVQNPDPGDRTLTVTAVSATTGANCAQGSTDSRCTATVAVVNTVSLTFASTASVRTSAAGQVVAYTVTATNSTSGLLLGVELTESLTGILDDAAYNGDVQADRGSADVAAGDLTWLGSLPAGETATITFSVTVDAVPSGNSVLTGTVVSTSAAGSDNCLAGSGDPRCTTSVPVAALLITQAYTEATTTPGSLIHLSATFTNTGQAPYEGITISGANADTIDDAIPAGDQSATSGQLVLSATAITWTGDIPVGGSVTVTGTLTVKRPDPGNKAITGTLVTTAAGSNCPSGGSDPRCTALSTVLVPQLSVTTTADVPFTTPGGVATYTVLISNTGQTPYVGASVTESLLGVLDDATFVPGDVTVSSGSASFASPAVTWTGDLAVGQTVTVTIPVTARAGSSGDKVMAAAVSSEAVGSTCQPANGDPACRAIVVVLTPALTFTSAASATSANPGDVVTSTVTVENTGQTFYAGATFDIDLAGVLDDATYDADAASSPGGTVGVTAGVLHWSGDLAPGDAATITYSVTVDNPVTGDFRLDQTVVSSEVGSTCAAGSGDPRCSTSVPIASLHLSDVASPSAVVEPGGVVTFTETYTNVGQVPLYGVHVTIDGHDVFDDATFNGDASASAGSLGDPGGNGALVWSGDLAVGASVTTTGSVTVDNPTLGNKHLRTRLTTDDVPSNCPTDSTDPECLIDVQVLTPGLSIVTTPGASTTTPGSLVGYTTTVTNTGETTYTGITVTDDLSGILDDTAAPTAVGASTGQATVTGGTLTWTGDVPVGGSVTISYTVQVDNPDPGDLNLRNRVSSDALGSSCPTGGAGTGCSSLVTVLVPALDIAIAADTATAYPEAVVTYTLTVTNSGQTDYVGAVATVALGGVLDDAVYNGDAVATRGGTSYTDPNLTWTGDLAVGESATVTYTVTVNEPDTGNRSLLTTVSSTEPGSSCPGSGACSSTVVVQIPALSVSTTADATSTTPGQLVTFTITIHNTGQRVYLGTVTTASLAGVLDDASLRGGFQASLGIVTYNAPNLTWTGTLPISGTATVTYTVRVDDPDAGDRTLATSVRNQSSGSTCRTGTTSSLCATSVAVLVPALGVAVTADAPTTTPGSSLFFTLVVTNSGETPYAGAVVTTSLASVLDDAEYGGDAQVTAGAGDLGYADGVLSWTGDLAVGASAVVRFSVTVHDPDTGDKHLVVTTASSVPGSSCPTGSASAGCTANASVLVPGLAVGVTADTARVVAGSAVHYTVTVENTGETDYAEAAFTAELAGVVDDGTLDQGSVTATTGDVGIAAGTLTWSGPLARGESATIGYDVVTTFPAAGDRSLVTSVSTVGSGSSCTAADPDPSCSSTVQVLVPALSVAKAASATSVVAGQTLSYTLTATNTGESDYAAATLDDDLSAVLAHATYAGGASASSGTVSVAGGHLTWSGPLAVGGSVVVTYAVTVSDPGVQSDVVLTNAVTSAALGSTCPVGGNATACSTSTAVDANTLTLSGLTSAFTLTGLPGDTVSLDDAVVGTVVTNSITGYRVTVQADEPALVGSNGNADTIPVELLRVRANGSSAWVPLSATTPVTIGGSDSASAPGGDAISNDAQIQIPDVSSGTYSGELDYIVATQ